MNLKNLERFLPKEFRRAGNIRVEGWIKDWSKIRRQLEVAGITDPDQLKELLDKEKKRKVK